MTFLSKFFIDPTAGSDLLCARNALYYSYIQHQALCGQPFKGQNGHAQGGNTCSMKLKIRSLSSPAASLQKKILTCSFQIILGFLFSNIVLSRGILPFGVAFAANSGPFGLAGTLAGYIAGGRDVLRYVIAASVAGCAKYLLGAMMEIDRGMTCFLFSLWGTMLGGLAGFFFSDYTFSENLRFMLSGLISGTLAYMFSMALDAMSDRPRGNAALRYVCFTVSAAAVLLGILSFGGMWVYAAQILTFFLLLCIGFRCTITYAVTTAALIGLSFCFYNPEYAYLTGILLLGAILSGLLKQLGKYAVFGCYAGAVLLLSFYFEDTSRILLCLFSLLLAGIAYLALPRKTTERFLRYVTPVSRPANPVFRKREGLRRYIFQKKLLRRTVEPEENSYTYICGKCRKKLLCWTKNYDHTWENFRQLKQTFQEPTAEIPDFFNRECIKKDSILRHFRHLNAAEGGYSISCAKAFAPKQGEERCGDTAGGFRTEDHRYVLSITDGMGTGKAAAGQSQRTTRMLRTLTEHGLSQEDILKLINQELLKSKEETVLGVDIAAVDLVTGQCELFKAGAAPTYILRGEHVYEIGSSSLPVGILEQSDFEHDSCLLRENDYLILVSDGILGQDAKWLSEFLNRKGTQATDCVTLADWILEEAKKEGKNSRDDMTVVTAQLKKAA